jgi:hypothetical protein
LSQVTGANITERRREKPLVTWRSGRRRRQSLLRLPGGAAAGPGDEPLAVEDLENAGHAAESALEAPRVAVAKRHGGHLRELAVGPVRRSAACRTIAAFRRDDRCGRRGGATDGRVLLRRRRRFRGGQEGARQ